MAAIELLELLENFGITVSLDRDELVLKPGSKVPSDILDEVRHHKAEIIQELRHLYGGGQPPSLTCECPDVGSYYDDYSEGTESCKSCSERCFCPVCDGCRWCSSLPGGPTRSADLLGRWESMGRPKIPLSPGVSISDLRQWIKSQRGSRPSDLVAVWSLLS